MQREADCRAFHVLVVDDEQGVRTFARRVLHREGYTVWEAADPDEALRFAEEHRSPIHVLLTDIIMPWTRGTEIFRRLSCLHPETRVVYMSGYALEKIGEAEAIAATGTFIQKPFSADDLADKVREALHAG